jgi:hypothetical protein
MIDQLQRFEGTSNGRYTDQIRITLSPRKYFAMNGVAYKALGSPSAVEFYFDEHSKKIGLRRCDPSKKFAFKVRQQKGKEHYMIYAGAFCTHFAISTKRTVLFEGPEHKPDHMVVVDMSKTTRISRGSR